MEIHITMISETNKAFCILPFLHTHLNTEGDVFPCCVGWTPDRKTRLGFLADNTLEELFNSSEMKQLRLDMVEGKRNETFCGACYQREDAGFVSARIGNNQDFTEIEDEIVSRMGADGYLEPDIKSWDIRFSNLCNLKCRSCGSVYSSTWAQEDAEHGAYAISGKITSIPNSAADPLQNQYDNVEKIYFAGGEPLIMPEHFNTLRKLIDSGRSKQVKLVYNTNMTKLDYNNNNLVDFWKEFKQVVLGMSIDATGDRAEYIRNGIPWRKIENNMREIYDVCVEYRNITYHISPTVSIMNVWSIPDMHKYFVENRLMHNVNDILLNILLGPSYYEIRNLPEDLKQEIKQKYIKHIDWLIQCNANQHVLDQFNSVITYIDGESSAEDIRNFVIYTKMLDNRRSQSFLDTFPEYSNWWKQIANVK